MNKIIQRLLVFFVGIPLILGVLFLRQMNHLALHILILLVSTGAAVELHNILLHMFKLQPKVFTVIVSIIPSITALFCAVFDFDSHLITYGFIFSIILILCFEVITAQDFADSNSKIVNSCFISLYSGFFITFISRMTFLEYSLEIITTFLLMTFMCDSFAWFFGSLFGKSNKGFIKASPNKSIAGFFGGILGSVLSGIFCFWLWPEIFAGSVVKIIILGLIISAAAIFGDLVESIIKRSANYKDSGSVIPGRGGILDSIDSIIFSAPVFYLSVKLLYGFI